MEQVKNVEKIYKQLFFIKVGLLKVNRMTRHMVTNHHHVMFYGV